LGPSELRKITRRFISDLGDNIGPHTDIPAPDLYTDAQTMAWIYDTYHVMHPGKNNLPVVTGKPIEIGGSFGRQEATGSGVLFAAERAIERGVVPELRSLDGAGIVVQGMGDVGAVAAEKFRQAGAKILAVSDSQGGVYSENGIDVQAVLEFKAEHGTVVGFPHTETVTNDDLLEINCDVLIPAALENQIRSDNADRIQTKLVVEGANGPTTPAADDILYAKGITVVPDILANAGGVTVSYFEWVQNIENEQWDLAEVNAKLQAKMRRATDAVIDCWERLKSARGESHSDPQATPACIDIRTAALVLAIERIASIALKRGIWP
jgi:glutamate dehydrogenase (NAD(P)+)